MCGDGRRGEAALELAYRDVLAAFRRWVDHHNAGRPFILAGHSQGAIHGLRLLRECVSGTKLRRRLIAAYLIGINIGPDDLAGIPDISPCVHPTQTRCVIGYRCWLADTNNDTPHDNLCVNLAGLESPGTPNDAEVVPTDRAVALDPVSGSLSAPIPAAGAIRCRAGVLEVRDLIDEFNVEWPGQPGNLHAVDFDLLHMDLRRDGRQPGNRRRRIGVEPGIDPWA